MTEIAKRGYEGAASANPKVSLFISDTLWG
jgi:hypothetical protein